MKLQISPPVAIGIVIAVIVLLGGIIYVRSQDAGVAASVSKQGQQAGQKMMQSAQQPAGGQQTGSQAGQEMMQHMRRPGGQ